MDFKNLEKKIRLSKASRLLPKIFVICKKKTIPRVPWILKICRKSMDFYAM
jgi:hypothetical protein